MKKIRGSFCVLLALMMMGISVNAEAPNQKENYPENFMNMSVQERIEWIDQNIHKEIYKGICKNHEQRGNLETYYGSAEEIVYDDAGKTKLAELKTAVEWTVDSSIPTVIQSYDVTRFDAYCYMLGNQVKKEPIDSFYVNQGNVKVFLQATAFAPYIAYGMYNNYNLHHWGDFSIISDHFPY